MKLTEKHHAAIELMITGMKGVDIGAKLDTAPETISRWRADYDFQAALNARMKENQQAMQDRLRSLADSALTSIESIMNDAGVDDKTRLTAACKVLELTRLKPAAIGSTNAKSLKNDDEMTKALEEFNL